MQLMIASSSVWQCPHIVLCATWQRRFPWPQTDKVRETAMWIALKSFEMPEVGKSISIVILKPIAILIPISI